MFDVIANIFIGFMFYLKSENYDLLKLNPGALFLKSSPLIPDLDKVSYINLAFTSSNKLSYTINVIDFIFGFSIRV